MTPDETEAAIRRHSESVPLIDRLRGQSFIPGVHYASQAEAWMDEAAAEIESLLAELDKLYDAIGQMPVDIDDWLGGEQ